ncbi:MAG: hypothetical protein EBS19_01400 [Spirochaetia bacterium]|nr:hypothetical protein [Spirochaetia bacterium]
MVTEKSKSEWYLEKSLFIEEIDGLQLWRLGENDFTAFNDFIFKVYSEAFVSDGVIPFTKKDIEVQSELYYNKTKISGIKLPDGTLVGTWGLVLKDLEKDNFPLPLETNYNMSISSILDKIKASSIRFVFNGWRTAVDKEALEKFNFNRNKSIFIFDYLLRGLMDGFNQDSSLYLGISEMEKLVYKYHRRIGIPWEILGDAISYWGRDRYPCAFKMEIFEDYLKNNHPDRHKFIYKR